MLFSVIFILAFVPVYFRVLFHSSSGKIISSERICSGVLFHSSSSRILSSERIRSRVLFHISNIILTTVLLLKRDFLFHDVACLGWLLENQRGGGASS
jgi:hypothetical protein